MPAPRVRAGVADLSVLRVTMASMSANSRESSRSSTAVGDVDSPLLAHVRGLSVADFEAAAGTTVAEGMTALFGPDISTAKMVYCDDLSAWDNGCTVIVPLSDALGGGVATFIYNEHATRYWTDLSLGQRMEFALRLGRKARKYESLLDLCLPLLRKVGAVVHAADEKDVAAASLNDWHRVWLLRHARSLLDPATRETYDVMAALMVAPEVIPAVEAVLHRADVIVANLAHVDEIEEVVRDAVRTYNGVELSGIQIQNLYPSDVLMSVDREHWAEAAQALVTVRYADGLDHTYQPVPEKPAPKPTSNTTPAGSGGWHFALAG